MKNKSGETIGSIIKVAEGRLCPTAVGGFDGAGGQHNRDCRYNRFKQREHSPQKSFVKLA